MLLFLVLFFWRYVRHVVHLISFWCYQPSPPVENPKFTSEDVTVILPTIDPHNPDFEACLRTCLENRPRAIIIVTAGKALMIETARVVDAFKFGLADNDVITFTSTDIANKRIQVAHAVRKVKTRLIVLLDDHVTWGPRFLASALLPFEDNRVGFVGTNKRVIREEKMTMEDQFLQMIQCLYLERHNFEIRASSVVDGGVFVISGRTSLIRTEIIQDEGFLAPYLNERFLLGMCGPLAADDDNFLTRTVVREGWKIKIQYSPDVLVQTNLGSYQKFRGGLIRWARTTWRSNSASLFRDRIWRSQSWCTYAVHLYSFTNFALFYDPALVWAFARSHLYTRFGLDGLVVLLCWMFFFKMVKPLPYFLRHPQDLVMLPGYFAFTWYHSLVKLWALLTFWDCKWSGRNLAAIDAKTK